MKNNTITILWPMPPLKGISQYLEGFVPALSKHKTVQVLSFRDMYPKALYPGGNFKDSAKKILSYPHTTISHSINRRNTITWIKAWLSIEWSILHMQYRVRFLAPVYITIALIARYIKGIQIIITIHNVIPHESSRWKLYIDKLVYKTADHYIVHSENNKQQLEHIIGTKDIHVFPHGIIIHPHSKINKEQAKTSLWISTSSKILLIYWHIRPYKWLRHLLEALSLLIQEDKSYHLIIAGQCREDRSNYQEKIDTLWLSSHITRKEWFISEEESALLFSASDLLILPYTHFDAQSGVIALWLWYEIPILVSNLWWLTEIIDDSRYVFEPEDILGMKECIIRNSTIDSSDYIISLKERYSRDRIVNDYLVFVRKLGTWKR